MRTTIMGTTIMGKTIMGTSATTRRHATTNPTHTIMVV